MKNLRLIFDLDGVVADFNSSAARTFAEVTGRKLIDADPWLPPVWNWFPAVGYRAEEIAAFWREVERRPDFWLTLRTLPDAAPTIKALKCLQGVDIFFLTNRPGASAHRQSVHWLIEHGIPHPQVITVYHDDEKGEISAALKADVIVDDKPGNLLAVYKYSPKTRLVLYEAPYNQGEKDDLVMRYKAHTVDSQPALRTLVRSWFGGA